MSKPKAVLLPLALLLFLLGCEAAPGERCDGFFSNGCSYPGMCVEVGDDSVCAVSCETDMDGERTGQIGQKYCADESNEIIEVTAEMGGVSGSMGCYCVPSS